MINYYLMTKPGIILGNLLTFTAGFLLASKGNFDFFLFISTLLGLAFIMASACVFNNYIDRKTDGKMKRTKNRALVTGLVSGKNALIFASCLGIFGSGLLIAYANLLAFAVAGVGFFVYVILYSMWKGKTVYGTAIGSVAGAVPPVVGYCAVSQHFDMGAFILFMILVLWQMPHFFSIALYHFDDYAAAKIPVLPFIKGVFRTKIHMVVYIIGFILTAASLTFFNYTGYTYLVVTLIMGLAWLGLGLVGFMDSNAQVWGRRMFQISLVTISVFCLFISIDRV